MMSDQAEPIPGQLPQSEFASHQVLARLTSTAAPKIAALTEAMSRVFGSKPDAVEGLKTVSGVGDIPRGLETPEGAVKRLIDMQNQGIVPPNTICVSIESGDFPSYGRKADAIYMIRITGQLTPEMIEKMKIGTPLNELSINSQPELIRVNPLTGERTVMTPGKIGETPFSSTDSAIPYTDPRVTDEDIGIVVVYDKVTNTSFLASSRGVEYPAADVKEYWSKLGTSEQYERVSDAMRKRLQTEGKVTADGFIIGADGQRTNQMFDVQNWSALIDPTLPRDKQLLEVVQATLQEAKAIRDASHSPTPSHLS